MSRHGVERGQRGQWAAGGGAWCEPKAHDLWQCRQDGRMVIVINNPAFVDYVELRGLNDANRCTRVRKSQFKRRYRFIRIFDSAKERP